MTLKTPVGFQKEYIISLIIDLLRGKFVRRTRMQLGEHNGMVPRKNMSVKFN